MVTTLELIPIGTVLAILTTQVLKTAVAAHEVLIESESFRTFGQYIQDVYPLLEELRKRQLNDSPAVRAALQSLHDDLERAKTLVDSCRDKPRMYLLVRCRSIVSDAQQILGDLAKSLQLMALAVAEVSVDIAQNVNRLTEQMMKAQFQASQSKLVVVNKLEEGLREHRTDQGFANDLIKDIARAVGIPVDASEITKELASFKREKNEAALRKELEEEAFMEQVIALLSRADSAHLLPESSRNFSYGRVEREDIIHVELIPPLLSFTCPLNREVMVDPVSLVTGACFERNSIEEWFRAGNTTDPCTHTELSDRSLRPNLLLRQSIEEWQERNYCIGVLKAKNQLKSGNDREQVTALKDISELIHKSKLNQDWIETEGLVKEMVRVLSSSSPLVKREGLSSLRALVKGNAANKELLAKAGGVEQVVRCLGRDLSVAKAAAVLLLTMLDGNDSLSASIGQERSAILLLVTLLNSKDEEAVRYAGSALDKLSNVPENVVQMAAANWCTPLIAQLCEGKEDACKVVLAKALGTLSLTDDSRVCLGENGAVAPLVAMLGSRKLEVKLAALSALRNLSTHALIKGCVARAGGMPTILNFLFSGMSTVRVKEAAAAIVENVAANDGMRFFVNSDGFPVDEGHVIENLLVVQENSSGNPTIHAHVLRAVLGLVTPPEAAAVRVLTRSLQGIPVFLPLIGSPHRDVRHAAVQVLHRLADEDASQIAEYLLENQKLRTTLKMLRSDCPEDVQAAAAGLLASFPDGEALTAALVDADAIQALVPVLQSGTPKAKEAAIGALIRFTDSSDLGLQRRVANMNVHPHVVRLVYSGSNLSKARAATVLGNFSKSTPALSAEPRIVCGCLSGSAREARCPVHLGRCGIKTTFCLLEADAVAGLVALVSEDGGVAAEAGVAALETLVGEDCILRSGAQFLHGVNGIAPLLRALSAGAPRLKESATRLLERLFQAPGMKELYGQHSRIPLAELASSGNPDVKRQAARVLAQLAFISEVSSYY